MTIDEPEESPTRSQSNSQREKSNYADHDKRNTAVPVYGKIAVLLVYNMEKIIIVSPKYGKKEILFDYDDRGMIYGDIKWYVIFQECANNFYVIGNKKVDGNWVKIRLHRILMQCPDGMCVDHINHNGLDNRKENLRVCSKKENNRNGRKRINGVTSKYKGVCWHNRDKKYRAAIQNGWKSVYLGSFNSEIEAAIAYNEAAVKYHGEFAHINIIEDED